jgi:hypothetical protein
MLVITVAALLALPAMTAAAVRTQVKPRTTTSSFGLRGSGRYWVEVTAKSSGGKAPKVTVEAEKERYKVELVAVAYSVRGRWLGDGGFAAKLPGLGKVAVRFEQNEAQSGPVFPGCKGPKTRFRKGVYRGAIDFRGQRGFTVVHGRSAPGRIVETGRQTCRETVAEPGTEEAAPGTYPPYLRAAGSTGGGYASFSAAGPPAAEPPASSGGIPTVAFDARYFTHRHGVDITAITYLNTGSAFFHVPGWPAAPLTDATAAPPTPFTGTGVFHLESPTTSSWTGGLGIDFPGLGHVALSGPGFAAQLCENLTCVGPPLPAGS